MIGDIVDAQAKAAKLVEVRDGLGLSRNQVIALGDGANDLAMMAEAGVSIAYHAKPVVRAQATHALTYVGLDGVLNLFNKEYFSYGVFTGFPTFSALPAPERAVFVTALYTFR